MSEPCYTPTQIGPNHDGTRLRIVWGDGEFSEYEPRELRIRCPCAGCVDEMTGRQILRPETVRGDIHPTAIHYVGRYALQFIWSDGHDTGIYPYDFLRRIWDEQSSEGGAGEG
jgi:ATP-binding protein involved in chromosome partitioning